MSFIKGALEAAKAETEKVNAGQTTAAPQQQPQTTQVAQQQQTTAAPSQQQQQTTQAVTNSITTQVPGTPTPGKIIRGTSTPQPSAEGQEWLKQMRENLGLGEDVSLEDIKQRLAGGSSPQAQQASAQAYQRQLLDVFLEMEDVAEVDGKPVKIKKTLDDFHTISNVTKMTDVDLVRSNFISATKRLNPTYTDEQIEDLFASRYFVPTESTTFDDATVKYGQALIKADADSLRRITTHPLSVAETRLKQKQDQIAYEAAWKQKFESFAAKDLPKKIALEIGKLGEDGPDLGTFEYDLSEQDIAWVSDIASDPTGKKFLQLFSDPNTGSIDLPKLTDILVWYKAGKHAMKTASGAYMSEGIGSVTSTLHNEPDLRHVNNGQQQGNSEVLTEAKAIEKNKAVLGTALGRSKGGFRKTG